MEQKTILYIEDEPDYQVLVSRLLTDAGYAVECADTAAQGLEILARRRPSLILLDINLPDASGFDLCSRIRQEEDWSDIPILMLTVRRRPEEWLKGFSTGADDYLSKPYNPPDLVERVRSILNGRREHRLDSDDPENLLVEAAHAGNRAAFEVLIAKYRAPLLHSVRRLVDNPAVAEDIVSAAFANAYTKIERFDGTCGFFTWLYTIAENEMHVHWRRSAQAPSVELKENESPHPAACSVTPHKDSELRQKAVRKLHKAITTLPEDYRTPLRMHYFRRLSMDEIALQLNIPYGTACSRVYRGTSLLRKIFARYPKPVSL